MPKTSMTDEEKKKAEGYLKGIGEQYSEKDKNTVLDNEDKILSKMKNNALLSYTNEVKAFFSMLKDYFNGSYKNIPVKAITAIVMSLLYIFSPLDIIPDIIPFAGFLDDGVVIAACIASFGSELKKYEKWRKDNRK